MNICHKTIKFDSIQFKFTADHTQRYVTTNDHSGSETL